MHLAIVGISLSLIANVGVFMWASIRPCQQMTLSTVFICFLCFLSSWNGPTCLIQLHEYSITGHHSISETKDDFSIQAKAFFQARCLEVPKLSLQCRQQLNLMERLETSHADVMCDVSVFLLCFASFTRCQIKQLLCPCKRCIRGGGGGEGSETDISMKYPGLLWNKEPSVAWRNV